MNYINYKSLYLYNYLNDEDYQSRDCNSELYFFISSKYIERRDVSRLGVEDWEYRMLSVS